MIAVQKIARIYFAAFFAVLGAFHTLRALGTFFGWEGSRAPDVYYGEEMNFPEGIVLLLVAAALYRCNPRTGIFAALMAVINGSAGVLSVWALPRPFAFYWMGIWAFVFAVTSWASLKAQSMTPERAAKSA